MKEEIDIINHLLSVEKNAAVLIDNAVNQADSRTSKARNEAAAAYKTQYDECVAAMEKDYQNTVEQVKQKHQQDFEQFKSELNNQQNNYTAFNSLMDKLLFKD